jgi:hypothetical protein
MIFTAITIIFLPLSFFASYFGTNLTEISSHQHNSKFFWLFSGPISILVIGVVIVAVRYTSTSEEPDIEAGIVQGSRTSCFSSRFRQKLGFWKLKMS